MSSIPTETQQYVLTKVGTYENLRKQDAPVAKTKANEVLVKVHAVSLQYRDLAISRGTYPVGKDGVVPCSDMSGEVIAVGEDVTTWKDGDRVCSNFCTDHIFGDTNAKIIQTSLGGQSSAYNALQGPVPIKAGDTVLVLGTGGVSIFALQFAVASGATVIATSSSNEKLVTATKLGAKHIINYKEKPDWDNETNGVGVDYVIEVGGEGTLARSLNAVRVNGTVAVIGFISKDTSDANFVLPVITRSILVRGVYIGPVSEFVNMNRLINANPDKTKPVIDRVFSFNEAVEAYAHLESQKHVGKIVIRVA
ncbi:alcohol dehydrogenase [Psilocybe cyanescens]|uniref:Alcohol dehydrogenase n=1 Tax=Psilocybe cyanescens TaxID=93625 RepID=A0A409WXG7_PSICY|nr:alcohol dehydrogenase [Psilocybe cyanescens]